MSLRKWIGLLIVWLMSVVAAGVLGHAQAPVRPPLVQLPTPILISGADLAFRVEGRRGNTPVGRFVVRSKVDGPWVEPEFDGEAFKRLVAR